MQASKCAGFSDREVGDLLLRVCHDFGAPLRAIHIQTEMLRRNAGSDAALAPQLDSILTGAREADLLRKGLTSYAIALQVDAQSFRPAPLDVLQRVVLSKLRKELDASGAEVTAAPLPTIPGDQDRLMDVWEQILRNSLVHRGPDPPRIHIAAEEQGGAWLFSVRDNGPGVDARYLDSIFHPFERVHRQERLGPGLGLTICRAIVERHGGKIWAESQPGAGLSICWTLPAA